MHVREKLYSRTFLTLVLMGFVTAWIPPVSTISAGSNEYAAASKSTARIAGEDMLCQAKKLEKNQSKQLKQPAQPTSVRKPSPADQAALKRIQAKIPKIRAQLRAIQNLKQNYRRDYRYIGHKLAGGPGTFSGPEPAEVKQYKVKADNLHKTAESLKQEITGLRRNLSQLARDAEQLGSVSDREVSQLRREVEDLRSRIGGELEIGGPGNCQGDPVTCDYSDCYECCNANVESTLRQACMNVCAAGEIACRSQESEEDANELFNMLASILKDLQDRQSSSVQNMTN